MPTPGPCAEHDVDEVVEKLSAILKVDPKQIRDKLDKNKYFVWIAAQSAAGNLSSDKGPEITRHQFH